MGRGLVLSLPVVQPLIYIVCCIKYLRKANISASYEKQSYRTIGTAPINISLAAIVLLPG